MFEKLWRNSVRDMDPYIPGKSIEELKREQGIVEITRLGSNENPIGPSPKAIIAMKRQ
ncbi:hypothetical protein M3610_08730 [Neobacillus sp. MER 74]|uniref:hypothetical protein n=1 Tax=Neobacillus sp. MER 74 TaxID=2939566 RepID=UPI00203E2213|nr:hypothetical protein [Neobacillus sp. MER 74]MCM3115371.1 hypothetical protein [Neobacillus sp. MER 74]